MIKVYIASPYTIGDVAQNVRLQIDTVNELMNNGFAPFAPLYSHFQHMIHPRVYTDWLNIDFEWVKVCDCLLRLDGESSGADKEVKVAQDANIPVFYSIKEMYEHYGIYIKKVSVDKPYKKWKNIFNKSIWFLIGLSIALILIGLFKDIPSLGALILYLLGWFRMTDLSDIFKIK